MSQTPDDPGPETRRVTEDEAAPPEKKKRATRAREKKGAASANVAPPPATSESDLTAGSEAANETTPLGEEDTPQESATPEESLSLIHI